jgi:hypothetical protein
MRRLNAHLTSSTRAALLFTAVLAGADCTGTPLPEPPDELPRPDFGAFLNVETVGQPIPTFTGVLVRSPSGAVPPGAQVWAVNLDSGAPRPVVTTASPLGGFELMIDAVDQQRVRIVARTDIQHSPPLDLLVMVADSAVNRAFVTPLGDTRLGCLGLTPTETVVLSDRRGELVLNNQCSAEVSIDEARLLLGNQGIALEMPATTLMPGKQTKLTFTDSRGPSQSERLDILLLEVSTPGLTGRYAVDVFSDLK